MASWRHACSEISRPFETTSAVNVTQIGVAGADEFENNVSLGFSVSVDNARVNVLTNRYTAFLPTPCASNLIDPFTACEQGVFSSADPAQNALDDDDISPIRFAADTLSNSQTQIGDDSAVAYTAGVAVGTVMQVDVAYDYSELVSSTNASVVFRF